MHAPNIARHLRWSTSCCCRVPTPVIFLATIAAGVCWLTMRMNEIPCTSSRNSDKILVRISSTQLMSYLPSILSSLAKKTRSQKANDGFCDGWCVCVCMFCVLWCVRRVKRLWWLPLALVTRPSLTSSSNTNIYRRWTHTASHMYVVSLLDVVTLYSSATSSRPSLFYLRTLWYV